MTYMQTNLFMSKPGHQNDVMAAVREMKTEWKEKALIAMMFYGGSPVGPSNVITISTRFDSLDEVEKTHDDFFENINVLSLSHTGADDTPPTSFVCEESKTKEAKDYLPKFHSELMKVAKTGVVSRKTASRKISRITKKINTKKNK